VNDAKQERGSFLKNAARSFVHCRANGRNATVLRKNVSWLLFEKKNRILSRRRVIASGWQPQPDAHALNLCFNEKFFSLR